MKWGSLAGRGHARQRLLQVVCLLSSTTNACLNLAPAALQCQHNQDATLLTPGFRRPGHFTGAFRLPLLPARMRPVDQVDELRCIEWRCSFVACRGTQGILPLALACRAHINLPAKQQRNSDLRTPATACRCFTHTHTHTHTQPRPTHTHANTSMHTLLAP
jgi:hypothetical protein